mgnify:CR=1 FL=1
MRMKEYLLRIVPTVKDLLQSQGCKEESEILQLNNITIEKSYDSFGNDYDIVVIEVQTDKYLALKKFKPIDKVEKLILSAFQEATKGGNTPAEVTIRPNSNIQATLFESGDYQGWRNGYFRMFISHITSKKKQASRLKAVLEDYGITSFVAHEDINPTKEWQKEIQRALNSMDCMSAMLYDGFHQSNWCDQEVGIALGRNITVLPLLPDSDPYGFLGEYQGIKIKGMYPEALAKEIFKILCDNTNTRSKYLTCLTNLLLSSSSKNDALKWLSLIEEISNLDIDFWKNIQSHVNDNGVLLKMEVLDRLNKHFEFYNIPKIVKYVATTTNANDLPF